MGSGVPLLWGEGGSVGQGSGWMEELWLAALNNQSMMSLTAAHCLDYTLHISPLSSSLSIIHARSELRKKKKRTFKGRDLLFMCLVSSILKTCVLKN